MPITNLSPPPPTKDGILDRWLFLLWQKATVAGSLLWPQTTLPTEPAHQVLIGPTSGADAQVTFRVLATGDLPSGAIFGITDTASVDLTNTAGSLSAVVLPAGVDHSALGSLNTASYTHLTATNHTDLTDGGDSTLHFHATDRARANHTGTQTKSTISDFPSFPVYLFSHYASVGNIGTGEDDLYSDTIAAGQLATNGDRLEIEYGGTFVSSASATREIKVYFGGTAIFDTGALTLSLSAAWTIYTSIIRVSSTVIRYMVSMTTEGAALAAYTAVGEVTGLTLSNTNVLKITGEAAGIGAATDDVIAKLGSIIYRPA